MATNHPFWSLTPEALKAQATPPVKAEHGDRCACRHCSSGVHSELLQTSDYQRHEITRLTAELAKVKFALAVERYRYLTVLIERAIERKDEAAWAKACGERMGLGVAVQMAADDASAKGAA